MKKIAIFGINTFLKKNVLQMNCLNHCDIVVDVFTNNQLGDSRENFPSNNNLFFLKKGLFQRLAQVYNYLRNNYEQLRHVEVYVGGRFSFFYLLLSKLFRLKVIVVERGDLFYLKKHPFLTRVSMRLVYKFSDAIWYRELYAKKYFDRWGIKKIFFLSNCITEKGCFPERKRDIDFLWANTFKLERKSSWFVDILSGNRFSKTNNAMLGLLGKLKGLHSFEAENYAKKNSPDNLQIFKYVDPKPFYLRAKYFVFPSDVVYLNNALLEAMSYGVVPIISKVQGADLIVDDGISGFVVEHSEYAFRDIMEKILEIDQERYIEMARQAMKKVDSDFSYNKWCKSLIEFYDNI